MEENAEELNASQNRLIEELKQMTTRSEDAQANLKAFLTEKLQAHSQLLNQQKTLDEIKDSLKNKTEELECVKKELEVRVTFNELLGSKFIC